jgi:hypothetical protein
MDRTGGSPTIADRAASGTRGEPPPLSYLPLNDLADPAATSKIVAPRGPAGAIAQIIRKEDSNFRAAYLWGCLGVVGRHTSVGFESFTLLDALIPRLSHIGELGSAPPAIPPASAVYDWAHDLGDGRAIRRWARDSSRPDSSLEVAILDGDRPMATVTADHFRPDLLRAGKGNGRHCFVYPIPAELKDGRKHDVLARIAGTNVALRGIPRSIEPEAIR